MSSRVSWIDPEEIARLVHGLCPEEDAGRLGVTEGGGADDAGLEVPPPPLLVPPRRLPPTSTPAVAEYPAEEEVSRVRQKLERIKSQARNSGLIQGTKPGVEPARPTGPAGPADAAADAPSPAPADGPAASEVPAQSPPPFEAPVGTLGVRLSAFARWVSDSVAGADVFVIDSQGYPLVERGSDPDLLAAGLLLADATQRAVGRFASSSEETADAALLRMELGNGFTLTVVPIDSQYGPLCLGIHHHADLPAASASKFRQGLQKALG